MGNPYSKLLNSPEIQDVKYKFTLDELQTLSRIYTDLSARDYEIISKETFLQFFGLTGLWGERIFERFDIKHTENLGFAGFLKGLAAYCKCNEEEKIKLLFSLYDMDNDGYINRKELITMLYNFPKHYLREIIDDVAGDSGERMEGFNEAKRKKTMSYVDLDPEGLFKAGSQPILDSPVATKTPEKEGRPMEDLSDLIIAEEETDDVLDNVLYRNLKAPRFNAPVSDAKDTVNGKVEGEGGAKAAGLQNPGSPRQKSSLRNQKYLTEPPQLRGSAKKLNINASTANKVVGKGGREPPTGSSYNRMSTIMMDQSYVISTTFNVRVKEYAAIMFKGCEGGQRTGKINFDEFKTWITSHKVLLKVFDGAFHQDLWMTGSYESKNSSPESRRFSLARQPINREVAISGILHKKGKKTGSWKPRYYELEGPFLSYYTNQDKACLKGVLFLEGCSITEISGNPKGGRYGYCINHKSESYVPHFLYCDSKTKFDEWMGKLKVFSSTSITDFYQLREEIGTGKFSTVYKGISNQDQKEYAIKAIQKDKLEPGEKAAILSETSVMKMLDHPTTIKLIETIEVKNNLYIVMELVRDGDLFDYVVSKQFLEETEASLIMKQLLASVNYLHSIGIIHRDLKPENIMITKDPTENRVDEIKLIDFGFAKFLSNNTLMTEACGTPNYLAPEVIKGNGYDKKSDIFSLGVIMYFLIRGLLPFDAINIKQILLLTFKCEVPMADEHWQNVSPEGKDLLMKLLTKEPEQRIEIEEALKHPWIKNRESLKKYEGVNQKAEGQENQDAE